MEGSAVRRQEFCSGPRVVLYRLVGCGIRITSYRVPVGWVLVLQQVIQLRLIRVPSREMLLENGNS